MFSDAELLAYIENNVPSAVAAQIEADAGLLARVDALSAETRELTAALFRQSCPTADRLGDYHFGFLPRPETQTISKHLAICPHCARELVQMQRFIGDIATSPSIVDRVKVWLADLLPALEPEATPAYALRGADDDDSLQLYEVGGVQISVDVQDDASQAGHKSVVGMIMGAEDAPFSADLWHNGTSIASVTADDIGMFTFNGLASGQYELIIRGNELLIHIQSFTI